MRDYFCSVYVQKIIRMKGFIKELRRREVFRTAGLYVGVCWILIEAVSVMLPTFDAPDWMMRAVVIVSKGVDQSV